jgi:hypothetical protein
MPKGKLILHRKRLYDDASISELTLWLVPQPVPGSSHPFKYSLFYGRPGERWIGYDNEAGKGDHRHYRDREEAYLFTTPEQLLSDFLGDMRTVASTPTVKDDHDE